MGKLKRVARSPQAKKSSAPKPALPKKRASQPSPERALLAKAVMRHRDLLGELSDLRAKWQRASVEAQNAKRVIAQAENADAAAEDANVQAMIAGKDTAVLVRDSFALDKARSTLKAADKAVRVLEERIVEVQRSLTYSPSGIDDAMGSLLASSEKVQKLLDKRAELYAALGDLDNALLAIWRARGLPQFKSWTFTYNTVPDGEVAQSWKKALAALREDANAPLPV